MQGRRLHIDSLCIRTALHGLNPCQAGQVFCCEAMMHEEPDDQAVRLKMALQRQIQQDIELA